MAASNIKNTLDNKVWFYILYYIDQIYAKIDAYRSSLCENNMQYRVQIDGAPLFITIDKVNKDLLRANILNKGQDTKRWAKKVAPFHLTHVYCDIIPNKVAPYIKHIGK